MVSWFLFKDTNLPQQAKSTSSTQATNACVVQLLFLITRPMFEDDIPSVMELEMEDLENWISKGDH